MASSSAQDTLNVGSGAANASRDSQAPLLSAQSTEPAPENTIEDLPGPDGKPRKRDFFRFGRKEDEKKRSTNAPASIGSQPRAVGGLRPTSPLAGAANLPGSPSKNHPYGVSTSPRNLRSASPRPHSPASSMIFERSVQEDVDVAQASPQIPSHIITENHIPPALDATSEAITDRKLNPDAVEIVTHNVHQPAAVTITSGLSDQPVSPVPHEDMPVHFSRQDSDNASNYASLESADVRRLSFISFADVVHSEHEIPDGRRDSTMITSHPSLAGPRSPSPMVSPISSQVAGTSPPTSVSASMHEASPHRPAGDLNFETMSQALRKTGSGDLSGFRSAPMSAVGNDDGTTDKSFR